MQKFNNDAVNSYENLNMRSINTLPFGKDNNLNNNPMSFLPPPINTLRDRINSSNELQSRFAEECDKRGYHLGVGGHSGNSIGNNPDELTLFSSILGKKTDEAIKFIMSTSIDVNSKDYWGNNVLVAMAMKNENHTLETILTECYSNFSESTVYDLLVHLVSKQFSQTKIDVISSLLWKMDLAVLNKQDDYGNTIIMHALSNKTALEFLLKNANVDLSIENLCGNNPVSYCVQCNNESALKTLIEFMKKNYTKEKTIEILNHKNFMSQTPLLIAIESKSHYLVKLLLNTGLIDINIQNHEGKNALLIAIEQNLQDITDLLCSNCNINYNISDNFGNTPIIRAIELNNHKLIFSLLNKASSLACKDVIGRTPLIHSLILKYKTPKVIKSSIPAPYEYGFAGGTYVELPSCFGSRDFMAFSGPEEFAKNNKLDVNLQSNSHLHDVIACKLIKLLGSEINVSDIQGNTPFSLICDNSDIFLFDSLLENLNFNPHFKNVKGVSCYEYIKQKYETLACSLFGSKKYCPLKVCDKHEKYEKVVEKVTKPISPLVKLDSKLCDPNDYLDDDSCCSGSDCYSDLGDDLEFENHFEKNIPQINFKLNERRPLEIDFSLDGSCPKMTNIYRPTKSCYSSIVPSRMTLDTESQPYVCELSLKKFSTVKYFYEKTEKFANR